MVKGLLLAVLAAGSAFVPLLQSGDTIPPIPLVAQNAQPFSLAQLRGNAIVLSFIYSRCPDPRMCPLTSSKFARLQTELRAAPVRLVEITLDPAFDTPRVLRAYGKAYGADPRRWTIATGTPGSIDELAARLGVASRWTTPTTLVHTEAVAVIDRDGRFVQTIDGNAWSPDEVRTVALNAAGQAPPMFAQVALWLNAAVEACGGGRGGLTGLEGLAVVVLLVAGSTALLFRSMAARL